MKLHDLRPAEGSRKDRIRVGRGIAAGKGKTAGRGTKGQKARAGGGIPPWFEGGQTPLHMRIPKLRGFKNRFKIQYEVVNIGAISAAAERGAFEVEAPDGSAKGKAKAAPQITVNQDILRAVGLVRTLDKPLKILGTGELALPLFVVADAFTKSARAKIEAAGGTVNVLEIPGRPLKAIGLDAEAAPAGETAEPAETEASTSTPARPKKSAKPSATAETSIAGSAVAAEAAPAADPDTADTATEAIVAVEPEVAAEAAEATVEPETTLESESGTDVTAEPATADSAEAETASGDDA